MHFRKCIRATACEACGYKKLPLERNSVFINLPLWMKGRELVEIARGAAL
jgi:hypothetical protein